MRRRVLKAGVICFHQRHATLPCVVRDVSETGARLRTKGSISAPDHFELHIELDGLWADCRVVWRRGTELGVAFTSPVSQMAPKRRQVVELQGELRPSLRRAMMRQ